MLTIYASNAASALQYLTYIFGGIMINKDGHGGRFGIFTRVACPELCFDYRDTTTCSIIVIRWKLESTEILYIMTFKGSVKIASNNRRSCMIGNTRYNRCAVLQYVPKVRYHPRISETSQYI